MKPNIHHWILAAALAGSVATALANPMSLEHRPLEVPTEEAWPDVAAGFGNLRQAIEQLIVSNDDAELAARACHRRFANQPRMRHACLQHTLDQLITQQAELAEQAVTPFRETIRQGHGFADERQIELQRARREVEQALVRNRAEIRQLENKANRLANRVQANGEEMDRDSRRQVSELMNEMDSRAMRMEIHHRMMERSEVGLEAVAALRDLYDRFDDFARILDYQMQLQVRSLHEASELLDILLPVEETLAMVVDLSPRVQELQHHVETLESIDLRAFFDTRTGQVSVPVYNGSSNDAALLDFLNQFVDAGE